MQSIMFRKYDVIKTNCNHKRRSVMTPALETLRELVDLRTYRAIVMDRYSESPKDRIEW